MKNKKTSFFLVFFSIFLFSFYVVFFINNLKNENQKNISGIKTTSNESLVWASIGEHRFTLFGYTSPYALVTFSGLGIFDQTTADENGYFIFKNRFSPFSPREACLTAQDQFGRLTSPLCLPPFPTDYNVEIGPVIMPPTLSLDKNEYWVGDEVVLTGQSVPNSQIDLSFYSQNTNFTPVNFLAKIFPKVFAESPNKLQSVTDSHGNFSINLSLSQAQKIKLFTQVNFQQKNSPESRKLTVNILPWWAIIFKFFEVIFSLIKSRLLEFIILLEIIILLLFFLKRYLHPRSLAIIKREGFPITSKRVYPCKG
jgi:hypothetical protein